MHASTVPLSYALIGNHRTAPLHRPVQMPRTPPEPKFQVRHQALPLRTSSATVARMIAPLEDHTARTSSTGWSISSVNVRALKPVTPGCSSLKVAPTFAQEN